MVPTNPAAQVHTRVERARQSIANHATQPPAARPAPTVIRDRQVIVRERANVPNRQMVRDRRGNYVVPAQVQRVNQVNDRVRTRIRRDRRISNLVEWQVASYTVRHRPDVTRRFQQARRIWVQQPAQWALWYDYGFYGGYYWDIGQEIEISDYYYNPVINYYFTGEYDWYFFDSYYRDWSSFTSEDDSTTYGNYQEVYREVFPFVGAFLPTETLRDLLIGVSGMAIQFQNEFKLSLKKVAEQMQNQLRRSLGQNFKFGRNDIIITHYRLLDGIGTVIEGTAGQGATQFPMKAVLNFEFPERSLAFVALTTNPKLVPSDVMLLDKVNDEIDRLFHGNESREYLPIDYALEGDDGATEPIMDDYRFDGFKR